MTEKARPAVELEAKARAITASERDDLGSRAGTCSSPTRIATPAVAPSSSTDVPSSGPAGRAGR